MHLGGFYHLYVNNSTGFVININAFGGLTAISSQKKKTTKQIDGLR
jgi:hypothetical protein